MKLMRRRTILLGLITGAILGVLVSTVTYYKSDHLSAYGERTDQLSRATMRAREQGHEIQNVVASLQFLAELDEPRSSVAFLFGVPRPPSEAERHALDLFVKAGGRVVVSDDVGYGNLISRPQGVVFFQRPLWDAAYADNASLIPGTWVLNDTRVSVLYTAPTGLLLETVDGATSLARSSRESYVDLNGNGLIDAGDRPGPFDMVLATAPNVNGGFYVFIADANVFMDGMLDSSDNGPAFDALLAYLAPGGGTLVFEERHRSSAPDVAVAGTLVSLVLRPIQSLPVAVLGLGVGGALTALAYRRADGPGPWLYHFDPDRVASTRLSTSSNHVQHSGFSGLTHRIRRVARRSRNPNRKSEQEPR